MQIKDYINTNSERFLEELFALIRIPSVSARAEFKPEIERCAQHWKELLLSSGADHAEVYPTAGNPVVYGEKNFSPDAPTVLIYSHYDVMPVEPLDLWHSDPFEPVVREGKIWARGADDDKGQAMIQVKGFETALKHNLLQCNVKFLFEGEEEIGSSSLEAFCVENSELLQCDVILVSDTSMVGEKTPSITTGLRGLAFWQIEVTGPNRDLHSGIFGGAVGNPINELCKMLASVTDTNGRITIPGFYDNVEEVSSQECAMLAQVPYDENAYKEALEVDALFGEKGYSTLERTGMRPTFDICGIWGGYTGEGPKTVLPSKAYAKVSARLVPHQTRDEITTLFTNYIHAIAPPHVRVEVTPFHGGEGYVCPITHPAYIAAEKAYTSTFGVQPLAVRRGGSIPIIAIFEKILGAKTILMGFGLESDAIHSPNENFKLDLFFKGIETVVEFYREFK